MMKEYKIVQGRRLPPNEAQLNKWAEEGWNLVQVVELNGAMTINAMFWTYLERDKEQALIK